MERHRADVSIALYHLNHEAICTMRHREVVTVLADIAEGKRLYELITIDPPRSADFQIVPLRLLRAKRRDTPFSGDMRFLLRGSRNAEHSWIQELLEV